MYERASDREAEFSTAVEGVLTPARKARTVIQDDRPALLKPTLDYLLQAADLLLDGVVEKQSIVDICEQINRAALEFEKQHDLTDTTESRRSQDGFDHDLVRLLAEYDIADVIQFTSFFPDQNVDLRKDSILIGTMSMGCLMAALIVRAKIRGAVYPDSTVVLGGISTRTYSTRPEVDPKGLCYVPDEPKDAVLYLLEESSASNLTLKKSRMTLRQHFGERSLAF